MSRDTTQFSTGVGFHVVGFCAILFSPPFEVLGHLFPVSGHLIKSAFGIGVFGFARQLFTFRGAGPKFLGLIHHSYCRRGYQEDGS
jgi:hypothetical protein